MQLTTRNVAIETARSSILSIRAEAVKKNRSTLATAQELAAEIERAERKATEKQESMQFEHKEPPCCSSNPWDYLPKRSTFDPVNISFSDLAAKKKVKDWNDIPLKEQVSLISEELKVKGFMLDQNSIFMKRWDIIMLLCLLYVA